MWECAGECAWECAYEQPIGTQLTVLYTVEPSIEDTTETKLAVRPVKSLYMQVTPAFIIYTINYVYMCGVARHARVQIYT